MEDYKIFENKDARVVAKVGNSYIVTTDNDFKWDFSPQKAFLVGSDGKIIAYDFYDMFLREGNLSVTRMDEPLNKVIVRKKQDIVKDGLLGFAVGDAFGVPVEFLSRKEVRRINLQDMVGRETPKSFKSRWGDLILSGCYSDDTAMLISSMDSIIKQNGEINYYSIMNNFLEWVLNGKYSSLPFPFGMGGIIMKSLDRYARGAEPLECGGKEFMDNGNGSLMRILPFSLYCIMNDCSEEETARIISEASSLTHANDISKMSCFFYTEFLRNIINTKNPSMSFYNTISIDYSKYFSKEAIEAHKQLLDSYFDEIPCEKIKESGYVVDSLESAIYSILTTKNYEDAVKTAVNMGYDTDTVAGITGSIAGILYGFEDIPDRWISKLRKKDYLERIASDFKKTMETKIEKKNNSSGLKI